MILKYASEVIELLGAHPHREFRVMEIVNFIIGADKSRREREATRKAVTRVLDAMGDSGSIIKTPSIHKRGGYAVYQIRSEEGSDRVERSKFGVLGSISPLELEVIREKAKANGLADPYRSFTAHKAKAADRKIAFELSFCEWWGLWKDKYHLRGNRPGSLCMARRGHTGPYSVGNVYIATNHENMKGYQTSDQKVKNSLVLKEKRKQKLLRLIRDSEKLPPPIYTYEQVVASLKLGIPVELRPKSKVGHGKSKNSGLLAHKV